MSEMLLFIFRIDFATTVQLHSRLVRFVGDAC